MSLPGPRKGLQRKTALQRGAPMQRKAPLPQGKGFKPATQSTLARGKPLTRVTLDPAKANSLDKARSSLPAQSAKRKAEVPARRKVVTTILAIQPRCVVPRCLRASVDVHERKTRGRGGSPLNPYNTVGLCRPHHDQITAEAKWAYPLGLLVHGWDPEPSEPAPVLSAMQKAAVERVVREDWWPTTPLDVEAWWMSVLSSQRDPLL